MRMVRRLKLLAFWFCALAAFAVGADTPYVSQVQPNYGVSGQRIVVFGGNFLNPAVSRVFFGGGLQSAVFQIDSDNIIEVLVPDRATIGAIEIENGDGDGFSTDGGLQEFVAGPYVDSFARVDPFPPTPADAVRGQPGDKVSIQGLNFEGNDPIDVNVAVFFGGVRAQIDTGSISSGSLYAYVPQGAATGAIIVTNLAGGYKTFSYFYLQPIIQTLTAKATAGSTINLTGVSLLGTTQVSFGGIVTTNFVVQGATGTNIAVVVPSNAPASSTIAISSPGGTFITVNHFLLLPSINSFAPAGGAQGSTVTLQGTGFDGATAVTFGGVAATPVAGTVTTGSLSVVVPNNALTGPLTVTTPNGTSSNSAVFYVAPSITGINPIQGVAGATVTLTGANFTGATSVAFSNAVASTFNIASSTSITVSVPANAASGPITVTGPGGSVTSVQSFQVLGRQPFVNSFTPEFGPAGTVVQIYGLNLSTETGVFFAGGVAATNVHVLNDTNLVVTVPARAITGPIQVVNPSGQGTSIDNFTVGSTADIAVSMTANPNPPVSGSDLELDFTVRNLGPLPASAPRGGFSAPAGTTLLDALAGTGTHDIIGNSVSFLFGDIPAGGLVTGQIRMHVNTNASLALTFAASSDTPDSNSANNSSTLNLISSPLALSVSLVGGSDIHLSWPAVSGNYILEASPSLAPGLWTTVSNEANSDGTHFLLDLPAANLRSFYRLRQQ